MTRDAPRLLAGRYRLGAELGKGGMAVVYRARDELLERDVAVKVVTDQTNRERFLSEAKRTAQIKHAAVIEVYDTGEEGTDAFFVMELLEGETLHALLARQGTLAPARSVKLASPVCYALGASHALGIVHRDVKPANVFVRASTDGATDVKVLDFGVAKRVDGSTVETDPGVMVGTFAYMAPEQIKGEDVDGRADLYAVGVTLFRMIAGRLPFEQESAASLIFAHLSTAPPRLPGADADPLVARVDGVTQRLLSKSREGRPADAAAARAALVDALAGASAPALSGVAAEIEPMDFEIDRGHEPPPGAIQPARAVLPIPHAPGDWRNHPPAGAPGSHSALAKRIHGSRFGAIPTALSKRVAGYGLLLLVVLPVFFSPPLALLIVIAVFAGAGLVAYVTSPEH